MDVLVDFARTGRIGPLRCGSAHRWVLVVRLGTVFITLPALVIVLVSVL